MTQFAHNNLQVRNAVETDLAALVRMKPSAAVHRDRICDAQGPNFRYLVLELDSVVIGFACLVFVRPAAWSDADDKRHLPQVVDLRIEPDLRGKGYGSYFLHTLEQLARAHSGSELYLCVDPVDNPRAHALYRRLGYEQIQTEPYRDFWEFIDSDGNLHRGEDWAVDMVKRLNDK